jgi:N-methylhydantoinase B
MSFAAVAYVLKCLIAEDIPFNEGFYRTITMIAPEGTVVNPLHPAPVAGGWEITQRLAETVLKALAPAIPNRVVAASKGCICNIAFGGQDPRRGTDYTFYETIAGGHGARPTKDGMDGVQTQMHNTENAPVEETEVNYPIRIVRYELIEDSGGAGKFRGGLGIRRDYCFLDHEATFTVLSDRSKFAPWGLFGGLSGRPARYVFDPDGENRVLRSKTTLRVPAMKAVSVQTPGGGGYGPPWERDPLAVLEDVKAGKLSAEKARELYGVALDNSQAKVDEDETGRLRSGAGGA